jgi:hypothetical protein
MEYENELNVGGGIKTICILHFVFGGIGFLLLLFSLLVPADIKAQTGLKSIDLILPMLSTALLIASCIMVLLKQKIGVFLYFIIVIINFIINIVSSAPLYSLAISLVLPVLMAIFISKKREVFGLGTK